MNASDKKYENTLKSTLIEEIVYESLWIDFTTYIDESENDSILGLNHQKKK